MIQVVHLGSRIRIFYPYRVKKAPDSGSRIRIRNIGKSQWIRRPVSFHKDSSLRIPVPFLQTRTIQHVFRRACWPADRPGWPGGQGEPDRRPHQERQAADQAPHRGQAIRLRLISGWIDYGYLLASIYLTVCDTASVVDLNPDPVDPKLIGILDQHM